MLTPDDLKRLEKIESDRRCQPDYVLWLCAKLRDSNEALERVCEVRGTMECPLCGHDQPHNHDKWIGVDLDGTLAVSFHDHQKVVARIGKPIAPMVERIKQWLRRGIDVRIVTARVCSRYPDRETERAEIKTWLKEHVGRPLIITAEKDYAMIELWDDRAVRVVTDTGERCCG